MGLLNDETYRRNTLSLSTTFLAGAHEVKVGAGSELEYPNRTTLYCGGEYITRYLKPDGSLNIAAHWYLPQMPLNCTQKPDGERGNFGLVPLGECSAWEKAAEVRSDFRARTAWGFVQDTWRPRPNLTIKVGVRYDYQELTDTFGNVTLNLTDQWSPRLSAAWDPGGNGRTKIFASYGRYYQMIPQHIQAAFGSGESIVFAYNNSPDIDPVATYDYAVLNPFEFTPAGVKGIFQDEIVAGAEFQVGSSWSLGIRGLYRALGRAIESALNNCINGYG